MSLVSKSLKRLAVVLPLMFSGAIQAQVSKPEIGVLMASHGDIDDVATELEFYVNTAFQKNVGIPFPFWFRPLISKPAYLISSGEVKRQYGLIGPTNYRATAAIQMEAITRSLQALGLPAKAYFGANFTHPLIEETLAQMQKDGIKKFIVINKGGQFSWASAGENIGDARDYLKKHPEWDVEAIGLHQYNYDIRFREAWASAIERDIARIFPQADAADVCLFVGSHGLPEVMTNAGDPAVRMMKDSVAWLRTRLPEYRIFHGFLNDDFIPGAKWVGPRSSVLAESVRKENCQHVLMDSRLSFTNHHRATLYDLDIEVRDILERPELLKNGKPDPNWVKPEVVLAPQFDGDKGYADAIAAFVKEALYEGKGDFEVIKKKGGSLLPRPDYPVKSKYIEY